MSLFVGSMIGLVLGLTGAGGSVLAVPLLILLLGLSAQQAISISLAAVFVSSTFGILTHLKSNYIQWLPAVIFALLGSLFTPFGVWLGQLIDTVWLMTGFALLVILIAFRMWQQAVKQPKDTKIVRARASGEYSFASALCRLNHLKPFTIGLPCLAGISAAAVITGILSGLFGVGGGFLIIPSLIYLTAISMQQAVATSLVVIAFISASSFSSHLLSGQLIDTKILILVATGGILGMTIGVLASKNISGPLLQKTFAIIMILMACITLFNQFY